MAYLNILAVAESAAGAEVLGAGLGRCDLLNALDVITADTGALASTLSRRPDVALVEAGSEGVGGLACIAELAALAIPVVAVLPKFDRAADAWDAGARGLVLASDTDTWQAVVEVVAHGGVSFGRDHVAAIFFADPGAGALIRSLTAREVEVLALVAHGRTNDEIARVLGVTASAVRYHLSMIFEKLDVRDRTGAVAYAIQLGVLQGWRRSRT